MANLALAWVNWADSGTWTASGFIARRPPSTLQNKHVLRTWRQNASSGHLLCDLLDQRSIDTIALMGFNAGTQPTRIRISEADTSGADGSEYDSGALSDPWDSDYLPFVHLLDAAVIGRYVRVDWTTTAAYGECGRGFIGVRRALTINFAPGWAPPYFNDPSIPTIGRGGQTYVDDREKYRTCTVTLQAASETELNEVIREINMRGKFSDLLFMTDPDSDNLSRDSIWGYFETDDPPTEPTIVGGEPMFTKTYVIRERL